MDWFFHDNLRMIAYGSGGFVILLTLILLARIRSLWTFLIAAGMTLLSIALLATGYLNIPIYKSCIVVSVRSSANSNFDPDQSYRKDLELRNAVGKHRLNSLYAAGALISIGLCGVIVKDLVNDRSVICNTNFDR
jgi:hypothetical protein